MENQQEIIVQLETMIKKIKDKNHLCIYGDVYCTAYFQCYTDPDNKDYLILDVNNKKEWVRVNFCPFCGFSLNK